MPQPADKPGAVIVCDLQGVIRSITHDRLGVGKHAAAGDAFVELVDRESMDKAAAFLAAIRESGGAFDWQLCVPIEQTITLLHCMGFNDGGQLWIVLAKTGVDAARMLEEMTLLNNEQTGMIRAALKYASISAPEPRDEPQFEELTRLYNEQGRMQRELAQRNAELEMLRKKLESQQIELVAANAKLEALATTDALTGVANRRAFQARLETECARSDRYLSPLALLLLDVDHFKAFNDTFGHQAGDDVLSAIGRLLTSATRSSDFAARYGGEEFAVILVNTDASAAKTAAETLLARIRAERWPHRPITASIGIASLAPGAETAADLIRLADKALYHSKAQGRNRVTHARDMSAT
jgi:diguanylate cyclase (GGDEF)-like protein